MAGSLNHIVTPDGGFSMGLIDHLGDAEEALEECFDIIAVLQLTHMQREAARMERALARMPVQLTMPCHVPACEG